MYLNIDSGKLRDVVAFGRATIDLYANEIGPMEDASLSINMWAALRPIPLWPCPGSAFLSDTSVKFLMTSLDDLLPAIWQNRGWMSPISRWLAPAFVPG